MQWPWFVPLREVRVWPSTAVDGYTRIPPALEQTMQHRDVPCLESQIETRLSLVVDPRRISSRPEDLNRKAKQIKMAESRWRRKETSQGGHERSAKMPHGG